MANDPNIPQQHAEPLPGSPPDSPQAAKRRVLVVEDDISIADLLVILLESEGFEVEVATDGNDALRLALQFHPELILLDIMLPGIDGFEVSRRLRYNPTYAPHFRATRILYLTAHHAIIRQRFKALPDTPVSDWILKPFDIHELTGKVHRVFAEMDAAHAQREELSARTLAANVDRDKAREGSRGFRSKLETKP